MNFNSKKISLIVLALIAMLVSRFTFSLFEDPEGPNLLVVTVLAAVLYFASLTAYMPNLQLYKKFILAICIQVGVAGGLYFLTTLGF